MKRTKYKTAKATDMNQEILNYFQTFGMGSCANGKPMLKSVVKNGERRMIEIRRSKMIRTKKQIIEEYFKDQVMDHGEVDYWINELVECKKMYGSLKNYQHYETDHAAMNITEEEWRLF